LAQEVFLRIYRARDRYEPRARFAAWIYKIATNLSLKEAGRKRRMLFGGNHHRPADDAAAEELSIPSPSPDAEQQLISSELGILLRRAIASLPRNEKVALLLRRYQELSYREIAGIMQCTEAAVKTYIHRGKLHVRDRMLPYLEKGGT